MSTTTEIEWTDKTWNPTTGCDRVSPGCGLPLDDGTKHGDCYALTLAKRLKGMGSAKYQNDGDPVTSGPGFLATEHPDALMEPLRWKKPAKVFVNSMSDLFHDRISDEFIAKVFATMAVTPRHTFQVLTKRHARMRSLLSSAAFYRDVRRSLHEEHELSEVDAFGTHLFPLRNVWLGVSVENEKWARIRVPALAATPAAIRFLSCEPLLGPLGKLDLTNIDWAIGGGESGPNFLAPDPEWVRSLRDQCQASGTAFLFKQWGGLRPKSGGRELDGRTWDEYPVVAP